MPKLSPVSYEQLVKVFEADGGRCVRTARDHMVFTRAGVIRPVVIPKYAAVPVFIIKNILRTAGISRDRYFKLLGSSTLSIAWRVSGDSSVTLRKAPFGILAAEPVGEGQSRADKRVERSSWSLPLGATGLPWGPLTVSVDSYY